MSQKAALSSWFRWAKGITKLHVCTLYTQNASQPYGPTAWECYLELFGRKTAHDIGWYHSPPSSLCLAALQHNGLNMLKRVKSTQRIFSAKFDSVGLCQVLTLFIKTIFGPAHLTTHAKSTAVHYQTPCCTGAVSSMTGLGHQLSVVAENMLGMISQ